MRAEREGQREYGGGWPTAGGAASRSPRAHIIAEGGARARGGRQQQPHKPSPVAARAPPTKRSDPSLLFRDRERREPDTQERERERWRDRWWAPQIAKARRRRPGRWWTGGGGGVGSRVRRGGRRIRHEPEKNKHQQRARLGCCPHLPPIISSTIPLSISAPARHLYPSPLLQAEAGAAPEREEPAASSALLDRELTRRRRRPWFSEREEGSLFALRGKEPLSISGTGKEAHPSVSGAHRLRFRILCLGIDWSDSFV